MHEIQKGGESGRGEENVENVCVIKRRDKLCQFPSALIKASKRTSFLRVPVFEGVGVGVEDVKVLGQGADEIDKK